MSKKYTVVFDELNLRGGGLYCFLPYENLDKHSKAIFKIGVAMNFRSRIEQYHTYFPNGVYMVAFLEEPPVPIKTRSKKNITKKELFIKIENFIMNYLAVNGAKRVYATTRIIRLNENKEGQTEWFYTNEDLIHEAFTEAKKEFGGETKLFFLEGIDPNTNKFISINDAIKKKENQKPNYVGKIVFHT
jgi:hypothetical protein